MLTTELWAGELVPLPAQPEIVPWPTVDWSEAPPGPEVNGDRLERAFEEAFADSAPGQTRALLVVHRGAIVAERYAPGFSHTTRFHSWSMAKSVTQAFVGILVREGLLDLGAPADVQEWAGEGDSRGAITLGNLLHMNSGLGITDDFEDPGDSAVLEMLYGSAAVDMAGFAASFPLVHEPGRHWDYSTGSTMIAARIIGDAVGGGPEGILAFMRQELFEPLGMKSVVPEFDAAGNFMGGGFVHITARDWARFGLLYLRDGVWDGRRVLPKGWVDYSRSPAPAKNNRAFGAHLWLNVEPGPGQFPPVVPDSPRSIFSIQGAYGQFVLLIPTHDLLIVRLGLLEEEEFGPLGPLFTEIVGAFPALGD